MAPAFSADAKYQEVAQAYASDCIDFAKSHFGVDLDWSDESIKEIERILGVLHDHAIVQSPSPQEIYGFAKAFGSYIGEVFRKNHGATWGVVRLGEESMPGLQSAVGDQLFWPWGKANNRIVNGPEDNMHYYYQVLLRECGQSEPEAQGGNVQKPDSWWSRLRGA